MDPSHKERVQLCSPSPAGRLSSASKCKVKSHCCEGLKGFLGALCFVHFSKALSGSYLKSTITQIERRFDIPSSLVGVIDGGFEIGNLLVIALVSYFGAKLHRPKIIGTGCLIMSVGTFLIAMPHFFMGRYTYERSLLHSSNSTINISPCLQDFRKQKMFSTMDKSNVKISTGCDNREVGSSMWIYVLLGNLLRGMGEAPIQPLGISYIDDYASQDNTAFYIGCVQTSAVIGPILGFLLGSLCAKLFVDIGAVNLDNITITPQDTRWVGAWWLGFIMAGTITLLSSIPFFFLPKSLNKESDRPETSTEKSKESDRPETSTERRKESDRLEMSSEKNKIKAEEEDEKTNEKKSKKREKATLKGFFEALKKLFFNPLYVMLLCLTLLQVNSFLGFITYKPKYMEQQYGLSISRSNFITGISTLPAAALGMFLGGLIMKKYKFGLLGASKMSFTTSFVAFLLSLSVFLIGCQNNDVAGITVSYDGNKLEKFQDSFLYSECNSDCKCSSKHWDPVCGDNQITYMSACLAGCKSSQGSGKNIVYYNCTCITSSDFISSNSSARLGACPRSDNCYKMFMYYTVTQAFTTLVYALGASSGYIMLLWSVSPELKALAVGVYMLLIRTLGGIPAPIYFGALIDKTCLKWGTKLCGGRGACRMYDADSFRNTFLGLTAGIRAPSYILFVIFILMVKKRLSTGAIKSPNDTNQRADCTKTDLHAKEADNEERAALNIEKETHI
ncbi:solute carrier organic anion transporter family member 1C1-like [Rhinophrynus dorsalis]